MRVNVVSSSSLDFPLCRKITRMALQFTTDYVEDSLALFRYYKKLGEETIAQVSDEQLLATLDPEMNSIAQIVKHIAGNMRSRWSNFLTSDGEKPDRNRDSEFDEPPATRESLIKMWEAGWKCLFEALEPLNAADVERKVTIRGEAHSVMQAVNRKIPLRLPYRADRLPGQALAARALEVAEHSAQSVGEVQPARGRW
jgi:Protein of unknown function (DUF1572)